MIIYIHIDDEHDMISQCFHKWGKKHTIKTINVTTVDSGSALTFMLVLMEKEKKEKKAGLTSTQSNVSVTFEEYFTLKRVLRFPAV